MPLVKKVRTRGANMVVVANGELLFVPGGDIARWNNSLSQRVRRGAATAAPANKRPRWGHYGKPLKQSITASTDIDTARMMVHTAVGSSAHYAAFVDQGTKSFQASILPPWTRGSSSLYEHTFKVPEHMGTNSDGSADIQWNEVGKITVSGQKARHFFDIGLRGGLLSMRVLTRNMPGNGGPMMSKALGTFPDRLANFVGGTPWSFAFDAQLREWRAWRDAAWHSGKILGQGYVRERHRREYKAVKEHIRKGIAREESRAKSRALSAERSRRWRERQREKNGTARINAKAKSADRAKFLSAMVKKYGPGNVDRKSLEFRGGRWYITVKVGRDFKEVSAPAKFVGAQD